MRCCLVGVIASIILFNNAGHSARAARHRNQAPASTTDGSQHRAKELVRAALEKDLSGDRNARDVCLRAALEYDPECALARWHLGEAKINGRWHQINDLAQ